MNRVAATGAAPPAADLAAAIERIAAGASERDATSPARFPADAFAALRDTGALAANAVAGETRPPAESELSLVRQVAGADGSVGRIFDGHLNGIERLAVHGAGPIRDRDLRAAASGRLICGVWGGDPVPGEGPPAALHAIDGREVIRGVKTFCSGAGGLQRAAVLVRSGDGPPVLVWIDVCDDRRVEVDETWYRARGLVASVSHRIVFHDAPVLARLGGPGAISTQPWFGRDALRTAASWAGMADTAARGALHSLSQRPHDGELEALGAGRILTHRHTIDAWLGRAANAMDAAGPELSDIALYARVAIADACRGLLEEAARVCGSRPFARAEALDRARRDLELFLLQHRLDPLVARAGKGAIEAAREGG